MIYVMFNYNPERLMLIVREVSLEGIFEARVYLDDWVEVIVDGELFSAYQVTSLALPE